MVGVCGVIPRTSTPRPSWAALVSSWCPSCQAVGVRVREREPSPRHLRVITVGVVTYSVVMPLVGLYRYVTVPAGHLRIPVVVGIVCVLPVLGWLAYSAVHGAHQRIRFAILVGLVAVDIAALPTIGIAGLGLLFVPVALIADVLPPTVAVLFLVGQVAAAAPMAVVFGHPEFALYYVLGVPYTVLSAVLVLRLVHSADALRTARRTLARQAVLQERLRIDAELGTTVAAALEEIADRGDRARALVTLDAASAQEEMARCPGPPAGP